MHFLGKKRGSPFLILLPLFLAVPLMAQSPVHISQKHLDRINTKYGPKALSRTLLWDKMMIESRNKKIFHKLKAVNDYFNKIRYKKDMDHWGKSDYWATPFELIGTGAGDCEDYAIAKYYSLKKLGVPEEKMRLTYVKYKKKTEIYETAHMVLTYYHKPNAVPIVLDNINLKLALATKRNDLKPIYSFNASGLIESQSKGKHGKSKAYSLKSLNALMEKL